MKLTLRDARRIALTAQGFNRPRLSRRPSVADLSRIIRQLGLVQLDYVKVLIPAHYLVFYSRLGPYDRGLFERTVYGRGEFTEQWAHEASVIPVETWPLLRHLMDARRIHPYGFEIFAEANRPYCDCVLEEVRNRGPLSAADLAHPPGTERRLKGSWYGTVPRAVLEMHFARGSLAVVHRGDGMSRFFDLAERALPSAHSTARAEKDDCTRALIRIAARAFGIATAADLADYFRMLVRDAAPRIAELVESGELLEVAVEGWPGRAYLDVAAPKPQPVPATTLLAPFDPLVWFRPRTARLFDFQYRFEIFVPPEKRNHGAYVLPFLHDEALPARVDLKADRARSRLLVCAAFIEPVADPSAIAPPLAAELRTLAGWLGFERISVGRRGNLARALSRHL